MDHLPAPADPIAGLPKVPYLGDDDDDHYDGGDFLAFPTRVNIPLLGSLDGSTNLRAWEANHPLEDGFLELLLQFWLFFGLLHELLNKHDLFDFNEYVDWDEHGSRWVHTRHLVERLRSWTEIVQSWEESPKSQEFEHLCACLHLAREAQYLILADHHAKCNRAVVWSLATIVETVASAVNLAFFGPTQDKTPLTAMISLNEAERAEMMRHGWCIHEIMAAQKEVSSKAGRFYLLRMRRPRLGLNHSVCDEENCKKLQIDLATFRPRHVSDMCQCTSVGPTLREVARCLDDETFPVLRIKGTGLGNIELEVVPYVQGMVYVALSHVWADGLGNPAANRLPRCQVRRLKKLINDVKEERFVHLLDEDTKVKQREPDPVVYPDEFPEMFIWCDTICCPVQDSIDPLPSDDLAVLKSRAIARLRQVYQKATYVLVLDRGLEEINFHEIDGLEANMRVFTSRWIRRLWTFQEGGLARRLLISFRDTMVDFRKIWAATHNDSSNPAEAHNFHPRRELVNHCFNLRSWFDRWHPEDIDRRGLIWSICWRRVSVAADEALCLAAAWDLDASAIAAKVATRDEWMRELWRQVTASPKGVSEYIIFNQLPRLSTAGFRWAPSTLLQTVDNQAVMEFVFKGSHDPIGTLTPHGLRVNLPGWCIRPLGPPGRLPIHLMDTAEPETHYMRASNGTAWYIVHEKKDLQAGRDARLNHMSRDPNRQWHIIVDTYPKEDETRIGGSGLLTSSASPNGSNGTILAIQQSEMILWTRKLTPSWTKIWETIYQRILPLREGPKIETISSFVDKGVDVDDAWARVLCDIEPSITYLGSDAPTPPALYEACRELVLQFQAELQGLAKDQDLMSLAGQVRGEAADLQHVAKSSFMGRVFGIGEVFGEDKAWCVD